MKEATSSSSLARNDVPAALPARYAIRRERELVNFMLVNFCVFWDVNLEFMCSKEERN